eukprot:5748893-Lingulodinium_polyedra.AAC.1
MPCLRHGRARGRPGAPGQDGGGPATATGPAAAAAAPGVAPGRPARTAFPRRVLPPPERGLPA